MGYCIVVLKIYPNTKEQPLSISAIYSQIIIKKRWEHFPTFFIRNSTKKHPLSCENGCKNFNCMRYYSEMSAW